MSAHLAQAQQSGNTQWEQQRLLIAEKLVEMGLENVSVSMRDGCVLLTFENRVFRNEQRVLAQLLQWIHPYWSGSCVTIVPQHRGIAVARVTIPAQMADEYAREQTTIGQLAHSADLNLARIEGIEAKTLNGSFFKADFVGEPRFRARFGNFEDPVQTTFLFVPRLELSLWKGMQFNAELELPLQDEIGTSREVKPGSVVLSQWVRPIPQMVSSFTVGHFSQERYGVDAETWLWLLPRGGAAVSGKVGYTGFASYGGRRWLYDSPDRLTWQTSLHAFLIPRYGFSVSTTYGRYVYGDRMWTVSLDRSLGETDISLFGMHGLDGYNAGFSIRVPLLMARHMSPSRIRARLSNSFETGYLYRGNPLTGVMYRTGTEARLFWKGYEPQKYTTRLTHRAQE